MLTVDLAKLNVFPRERILDTGCGSGRHLAAAYALADICAIGVDSSWEALQETRSRIRFHHTHGYHGGGICRLLRADATALPFEDGAFDRVICSEVLEHVADHRGALDELVRVLKPGHTLAVSVPRYYPERMCWHFNRQYGGAAGGHIRIYRRRQLLAMMDAAGITVRKVHHAHSLHSPYWWLKCLVGLNNDQAVAVRLYHRFLTWEVLKKPLIIGWIDALLNPVLGKSIVLYGTKR